MIDGSTLKVCIDNFEQAFIQCVSNAPAIVCCRCSPTQKAQIVELIKKYTKKRTAAIGDGGNDVSMIQAADIGLGIVGKEGMQASLAADFSLTQFSHIKRLISLPPFNFNNKFTQASTSANFRRRETLFS